MGRMMWGKKLKILILEDNDSDAELLVFQLGESEFEFECRRARNEAEYKAHVVKYKPDLVISDYSLPGYTGLDALRFLRSTEAFTPFVLVTGTLGEEKAVEIILAGANDFLLKHRLRNLPAALLRSLKVTEEQKERNKMTSELQRSELHFRGLIENSHDFIIVFDEERQISYASPALQRSLGYSSGEVVGHILSEFIHPDDVTYKSPDFKQLLDGKIQKMGIKQRWISKSGIERWKDSLISDQRNTPGIEAFVSNIKDIHDYVIAEQALVEKNFLLDSVMNNLHEGVVVSDQGKRIIMYNDRAKNILGFTKSNSLPDEWGKIEGLYHSDQRSIYKKEELPFVKASNGEKVQDVEMFIKNDVVKNGLFLNVNAQPLIGKSKDVKGAVISFSDITEKKHYQFELEESLSQLESRVLERTIELEHAHGEIEEAHKQITYSINYARRIQQAITVSERDLREAFTKSFLNYLPKDIVSGDFVWMNRGPITHLAVADCTGHGVPGAMMSMIGNELLEKIIVDRHIQRPEIVLEELDKAVTRIMKGPRNNEPMNDGMDLSICSIDYEHKVFSFAGAHNHGLFVRGAEATLIMADKNSIGGFRLGRHKEFSRTVLEYSEGDRLYLFTDGFQDQFGGMNTKKFTRKRLINVIAELQNQQMPAQGEALQKIFEEWKAKTMQVDDVTILGLEF